MGEHGGCDSLVWLCCRLLARREMLLWVSLLTVSCRLAAGWEVMVQPQQLHSSALLIL